MDVCRDMSNSISCTDALTVRKKMNYSRTRLLRTLVVLLGKGLINRVVPLLSQNCTKFDIKKCGGLISWDGLIIGVVVKWGSTVSMLQLTSVLFSRYKSFECTPQIQPKQGPTPEPIFSSMETIWKTPSAWTFGIKVCSCYL